MSSPETLYGPWDYAKVSEPYPYDDTPSYALAGEWVSGHGDVEDWGCGVGWMRQHVKGPYHGIDGAWSKFATTHADLREYRSNVQCAVMRHVLEHNFDWRQIAENFSESWYVRAALVLFIPPQTEDVIVSGPDWPVPDIAVSGPDLYEILGRYGTEFTYLQLNYPQDQGNDGIQWGYEGVLLMER